MATTTTEKKSKKTAWMIFLVSLVVNILVLIFAPEWCWVPLPFVLTYLVEAMDVI